MRTIFSWKLDMRSSGQLTGPPGTVLHYSLSQLEGLFCKKWDVLAMDSLPHTHMGQYLCKKRVFLPLFCKARTWKQEFWLVCPSSMDLEIWDRMKQKQYIHFFPTDCRTWSWKADHKKRKKKPNKQTKKEFSPHIPFPETWKAHVLSPVSCYQPSLYSPGAGHGLYQACFYFVLSYSVLFYFVFSNISVWNTLPNILLYNFSSLGI